MGIPSPPTSVSIDLPPEDRELFLAQMQKGYDSWIYHYTGNCFSCDFCDHGPPTEEELLPFFRQNKEQAASLWVAHVKG